MPFNLPPGYVAQIEQMVQAGRKWLAAQEEDVHLQFTAWPKDTLVTGDLDETNIRRYGRNEQTCALLRAMDSAINNKGTLLMAQVAVEMLEKGNS